MVYIYPNMDELIVSSFYKERIISNNKFLSKQLPFKEKITAISEKIEKEKLIWDAFCKNKNFRRFIQKIEIFDELVYIYEKEYSICNVTNTWLNIYECLYKFKEIIPTAAELNIFLNIDLPGETILSVNYFFEKNIPYQRYNWVAMQNNIEKYNDNYNIFKDTHNNWINLDNIDNIDNMSEVNYKNYDKSNSSSSSIPNHSQSVHNRIKKIQYKYNSKYDIFISNVDIENNIILDYSQFIIGLSILKINGLMVIQTNNLYTMFKIWIISTISSYFSDVYISKTEVSRSYSSNIFIICSEFKGISKNDLDKLYYVLSTFRRKYEYNLLSKISIDTVQSIYKILLELTDIQISIMKLYIDLFERYDDCIDFYNMLERKSKMILDNYIYSLDINTVTMKKN